MTVAKARSLGIPAYVLSALADAEGGEQTSERWAEETGRMRAVWQQARLHGWDTPVFMGDYDAGGRPILNTPRNEAQGIIDQIRRGRMRYDFSFGPYQQVYEYAVGSDQSYDLANMAEVRARYFDPYFALEEMAKKAAYYWRVTGHDPLGTLCMYNYPAGEGDCIEIPTDSGGIISPERSYRAALAKALARYGPN